MGGFSIEYHGGCDVEVRINGLIVLLLELSFIGAGCLIYILFPIPAIRFSHHDTRHSHSMATTSKVPATIHHGGEGAR
jgi:hypothetical protein